MQRRPCICCEMRIYEDTLSSSRRQNKHNQKKKRKIRKRKIGEIKEKQRRQNLRYPTQTCKTTTQPHKKVNGFQVHYTIYFSHFHHVALPTPMYTCQSYSHMHVHNKGFFWGQCLSFLLDYFMIKCHFFEQTCQMHAKLYTKIVIKITF